jgi:hypothetical protein
MMNDNERVGDLHDNLVKDTSMEEDEYVESMSIVFFDFKFCLNFVFTIEIDIDGVLLLFFVVFLIFFFFFVRCQEARSTLVLLLTSVHQS